MKNKITKITASTLASPFGVGKQPLLQALTNGSSGLRAGVQTLNTKLESFYGEVAELAESRYPIEFPAGLADFDCRNNRLALLALQADGFAQAIAAAKQKYGAKRIGIAVGTSTSGILATEQALAHQQQTGKFPANYVYQNTHRMSSLADFCAEFLQLEGPRIVISTACSSSAKVFASADRWLKAGLVDAVLVGGVDSLCLTTIHGFNSLGLISDRICSPLDAARDGINIGEAGGFMLLETASSKLNSETSQAQINLLGYGETSDAYHISSPHPEGAGAAEAMRIALKKAGLQPSAIDYINMHGTGTPSNDLAESKSLRAVFADNLPAHSSTKGMTGHTLGAAGIVEAIICELALRHNLIPANVNLQQLDPELNLQPVSQPTKQNLQICMSNSFGFGGNNASLIFGKVN